MSLNTIALRTIARREVHRILRIWAQTLVPPAITMTLYFLIFGKLIGSRIGEMGGFSYMDFIVPGLVMMAVIQNAYGNISSSFFGAKFGRHVEEGMERADAGIGRQHIDASEMLHGSRNDPFRDRGIADVALDRDRAAAQSAHLRHHHFG